MSNITFLDIARSICKVLVANFISNNGKTLPHHPLDYDSLRVQFMNKRKKLFLNKRRKSFVENMWGIFNSKHALESISICAHTSTWSDPGRVKALFCISIESLGKSKTAVLCCILQLLLQLVGKHAHQGCVITIQQQWHQPGLLFPRDRVTASWLKIHSGLLVLCIHQWTIC